jgi:hypothetical protein
MDVNPSLQAQLNEMRREVEMLRDMVSDFARRRPEVNEFKEVRIFKPLEDGPYYPLGTGDPNTFSAIFQDGYFTDTAGRQTPTLDPRDSAVQTRVHNLADSFLDETFPFLAFHNRGLGAADKGEWFTWTLPIYFGYTTTAHNRGATQNVNLWRKTGSTRAATGVLLPVWNGYVDLEEGVLCHFVRVGPEYQMIAGDCNPE